MITSKNIFDLLENNTLIEEIEKISSLDEQEEAEKLVETLSNDLKTSYYGHSPEENSRRGTEGDINYLRLAIASLATQRMKLEGTYEAWKDEFGRFLESDAGRLW